MALDFETATASRDSACALAAVVVDHGRIAEERSWLIRPPSNEYDGFNTMLHGIGPADTEAAPSFLEVFDQALDLIEDRPVVAHYAPFDIGVLRASFHAAETPWPPLTVACTVILSRRCWPGLPSYSLPLVAEFLELDAFEHHDAAADARTCAGIARALIAHTDADRLETAADRVGVHLGRLDPGTYNPCLASRSGGGGAKSIVAGLAQPQPSDIDPEHPFAGARVAFTGTLMSMPRRDAAQLVVNAGGNFTTSVSKKTDFLVFGQEDFTKFVDGQSSAKTKRAVALVKDGQPLQIIGESEFLRML